MLKEFKEYVPCGGFLVLLDNLFCDSVICKPYNLIVWTTFMH